MCFYILERFYLLLHSHCYAGKFHDTRNNCDLFCAIYEIIFFIITLLLCTRKERISAHDLIHTFFKLSYELVENLDACMFEVRTFSFIKLIHFLNKAFIQ